MIICSTNQTPLAAELAIIIESDATWFVFVYQTIPGTFRNRITGWIIKLHFARFSCNSIRPQPSIPRLPDVPNARSRVMFLFYSQVLFPTKDIGDLQKWYGTEEKTLSDEAKSIICKTLARKRMQASLSTWTKTNVQAPSHTHYRFVRSCWIFHHFPISVNFMASSLCSCCWCILLWSMCERQMGWGKQKRHILEEYVVATLEKKQAS